MKVMLRQNEGGKLLVYVPKKDLEEEVVKQSLGSQGEKVLTLANGWKLSIVNWKDTLILPITLEATRIST